MPPSTRHRALLQRCGAVVLFVGICLAALIYWSAPMTPSPLMADDDASLPPEETRRYAHDTEVNFGKVGLLADKGMRRLGEPKTLAITIVVVSGVLAGGCFLVSRAAGRPGEGA